MTIRFLTSRDGYTAGSVVSTLDPNVEAGYVSAGSAMYHPVTARSIVLLGDSYENKCGPTFSGVITSYPQEGYFCYANALLNGYFRLLNAPNAGVGGNTCAQIAARVYADALAYNPEWVLIGGSTNDDLSTPALVQRAFSAMQGAYDAVLGAGKRLIVCTRAPRSTATTAQRVGQAAYNARVRRYAQTRGAVLFDMAAAVSHPDTGIALAQGEYGATANLMDTDNTHLSFTGAAVAGFQLYQALLPYVQGDLSWSLAVGGNSTNQDLIWDATNGVCPDGNIFANGKMLGTGGTLQSPFTGSLAAGWAINTGGSVPATGGAGSVSKVAINGPTRRGEWQQIQITPGASGQAGYIEIFRQSPVTVFDGSRGLSIGDSIYGSMRFETDALDYAGTDGLSGTTLSFAVQCLNSSYATLATATALNRAANNGRFRLPSGVIQTPEITIPASTAFVFAYIRFDGVGTVRVTDVQGRKVVA